jgi:uroporphyrinogen decarboxylase
MEDAKRLKPADPYKHGRLPYILKAAEIAIKDLGDDYPVGGMADIPMHIGGCLMGWTQMFIAMDKDLKLWKKIEKVIIDSIWNWIKAQHKIGISVFGAVSELPQKVGTEEYFKHPVWMQADHPPEIYKRAWEELKIPIGLHPCTVGPFEPGIPVWKTFLDHCFTFMMPECGGADVLAKAKEELAPATMIGNINPVDIMLHGTPSEVEDACVELIKKCGPGGRFILSTGCEIPLDTPYENVKVMTDSVRKYGRYPINI